MGERIILNLYFWLTVMAEGFCSPSLCGSNLVSVHQPPAVEPRHRSEPTGLEARLSPPPAKTSQVLWSLYFVSRYVG